MHPRLKVDMRQALRLAVVHASPTVQLTVPVPHVRKYKRDRIGTPLRPNRSRFFQEGIGLPWRTPLAIGHVETELSLGYFKELGDEAAEKFAR